MTSKAKKLSAAVLVALALAAMLAFAGCASGTTAKAESKDNVVTVTLDGADKTSAFGSMKTKDGEAIKLVSNVTSGNATVTVKSSYTDIYTSRALSGSEEIGITVSTPGDLVIEVTGNGKASGTMTFEVVSESDIAGLDSGTDSTDDAAATTADDNANASNANANDSASNANGAAANANGETGSENANAEDNANAAQ